MMQHRYSYVVVRYFADRGAGECLNIGVVLYSQDEGFFGHRIDSRYERLSRAFAQFDGATYRRSVLNVLSALRQVERTLGKGLLRGTERSFTDWLHSVMPDTGGSVAFTPVRHGVSDDLTGEVSLLFERMVTSQQGHADEVPRRDDAQVWRRFESQLSPEVVRHVRPASFDTPSVKVTFQHAVKNGAWHVIQPVSMDYKRPESMQQKASQWVGTAVGLQGVPDLGMLFFLVGVPEGHRKAYERARALLDQAPVPHEIIEEDDAGRLSRRILTLLERHEKP